MEKAEVRARALDLGLGVAQKKDSQGICFLGKVKVPEFLSHFIEDQPGDIITVQGKVVGRHKGLHRYTLGQRRGIGVPSNTDHQNYVVTGKDQSSNQLIVAFENENEETLWAKKFEVTDISFLCDNKPPEISELMAKARYRDHSTSIIYKDLGNNRAEISFEEPQRALTPGQVLAFIRVSAFWVLEFMPSRIWACRPFSLIFFVIKIDFLFMQFRLSKKTRAKITYWRRSGSLKDCRKLGRISPVSNFLFANAGSGSRANPLNPGGNCET